MQSNLLVRTPKPHPLESYRGYLLRLSEANGLTSPIHILKLAGVPVGRMRCAEHPVAILSKVTGHAISLLAHLPLTHPTSNLQQVSGHTVSKGYSIISKSKICPCCIKENGYAPAFWDLMAVNGCLKHKQSLIAMCPECKTNLSYNRPSLLTCECGADLSELTGSPLSRDELEFLRIIDAKFNDVILDDAESEIGLPLKKLTEISLSTILAIMHTMGSLHLFLVKEVERAKACTHKDEIKYAMEIFKDWPNNFFKFLHLVGDERRSDSLGLDRQFSFFSQRFFKRGYQHQEIQFLKEAFYTFGRKHWGNAFYYPRMQTKSDSIDQSNFVGIYEFAERMGHTPSAVKTMISEGRLVVKMMQGPKVVKVIIDLEKSNVKLPNNPHALGERDAAKFLGLPVSVIQRLRTLGHYKANHTLMRARSFCIDDLQSLKQRILDCQNPNIPSGQLVTLAFIMRKSFRDDTLKSSIIEKILDCTLPCFGSEKELSGIQIMVSAFEAFTNSILLADRDWLSVIQTSAELHCDHGIVVAMLANGLLVGQKEKGRNKINKDSVMCFKKCYISLQQLSLSFKLGVKALKHLCLEHELTLLLVKRKNNACQNFIEKTNIKALAQHVEAYYMGHKKLAYRSRLESINLSWIN